MGSTSTRWAGFWTGATLGVFLTSAAFFLWSEHQAHLYGAIPYVLGLLSVLALVFFIYSHPDAADSQPGQRRSAAATRREDNDAR